MKTLLVCLSALALLVAAAACDGSAEGPAKKAARARLDSPAMAELAQETHDGASVAAARQRKLIRTANLELLVDDAADASEKVAEIARRFGGFVAESTLEKRRHRLGAYLVLRVPVAKFDATLAALKPLAREVGRWSIQTEDVTDRYVDLEARRRSLALTEGELEKLLAESRQQGRKADEIVAIYRELTEIRTRREQVQGLKQGLDDRIALSTIRVSLHLDKEALAAAVPPWKPQDTVASSFDTLIRVLKALADAVIVFAIVVLPVMLLAGIPVWLLIRFLIRKRTRSRRSA